MISSARHRRLIGALVLPAALLALSIPAGAAPPTPPDPSQLTSVQTLTPSSIISASKSATSRLAQTDPALLGRTDSTPVAVMIKLDYDSAATYAGGVKGVPATSPSVTGKPLSGKSAAEKAHNDYAASQEAELKAALAKSVPQARLGSSFRTVYGGVQAVIPANEVADVLRIDNVVAVQSDSLNKPLTDSSPAFIGATSLYPQLGGTADAGKGVIFGVLDSGAWPEHPSYADNGNLGAPPAKADGTPRACNFGDNPLTPATDVFACNNKLIGGQAFLATYLSNPDRAAAEPYHTARDSNGHGTHTSTTAAGDPVAHAPVLGVDRGPINGIAPGAWISVYKVCGIEGCYGSDSAAAVQQAILDGVKVINFSISGGTDPFTDPVELAFLDAYAAGVFVSASAGNEGPGAGTANHLSAWTTSVGASTQTRTFLSHLTVTGGGQTFTVDGASLTAGAGPLPVVLSSAAPYSHEYCDAPAAAGIFTGKIVACRRGGPNGRVAKGFNVVQGGAAGMILYNLPPTTDVETDNHFLPTVHLANGTEFLAFVNAHPGATAQFTAGAKANGVGDVMASFSSRGPAGPFIKPDLTAPGVQVLAGHSPTPDEVAGGPPGQLFQAIAGTSMSSPHIAGSAILLKALHPDWTPMQIRSAMMLTAKTSVKKENGTTAADPFDMGAGRVDLTQAGNPGLIMDESANDMFNLAATAATGVHVNQPSVNVPALPGRLVTTRSFKNITTRSQRYRAETTAPAGSTINVSPSEFAVDAGATATLTITIESSAPKAQYFGQIRLVPITKGNGAATATLHLPVAFVPQQGNVTLASNCNPTSIAVKASSTCTVTATNNTFNDAAVSLRTTANDRLRITGATGATVVNGVATANVTIAGAQAGVPSVGPGTIAGYIPLDLFGGTLTTPVGDESIVNLDVPSFVYNGRTYSAVGVDSNGYLVAGGGTAEDNNCCNLPTGADPAPPNNMLAPFWSDLDGTGATGILANVLTDGVGTWLVIEWRVNVFGTTSLRTFQAWIGVDGVQDIAFSYADPSANALGQAFGFGAENELGQGDMVFGAPPTEDQVVTSTDPTPGASYTYNVTVRGQQAGAGVVTSEMTVPGQPGATTVVRSNVTVS
jgi:hypothetical protein